MSTTPVETSEAPTEEPKTPEQTEESTPQEGDSGTVEETNDESTEEGDEKPGDKPGDSEDGLPEWAKTKLSAVRGEAAKYRTALREAESRLKEAKTVEEFESAVSELQSKNAALERAILVRDVAAEHGLPKELADLLQGDSQEALTEHAKVLKRFAPVQEDPGSLRGGLDPNASDEEPFDPAAAARKARARRI